MRWSDLQGSQVITHSQGLPAAVDALYFLGIPLCIRHDLEDLALAETFGPKYGIGYMFFFWFGQFNMTQVLAWIIIFVVMMLVLEHGVFASSR